MVLYGTCIGQIKLLYTPPHDATRCPISKPRMLMVSEILLKGSIKLVIFRLSRSASVNVSINSAHTLQLKRYTRLPYPSPL